MRSYAMLRIGGIVDFVRCHPSEIDFLQRELQGFVIGEGQDRREAKLAALRSGFAAYF